jgi:general secretion pathway protein C
MIKQAVIERWVNQGLSWACLPLVLASVLALSKLTWLAIAPSSLEPVRIVSSMPKQTIAAAAVIAPLDIPTLTSWQLFGNYQAAPIAAAPQADAPDTSLSLELAGVFVALDPKKSTAVILEKGREGQLYGIEDQLPGNAQLQYVYEDRVVIKRNGRFETLRFPKDNNADQSITMNELLQPQSGADGIRPAAARVPAVKRVRDQSPQFTPEKIVQSLQSGGTATLDQLGLETVDANSEQGYRVTSKTPSQLMSMLGLKAGDVLISVNGNAIGNITKDQTLLNQVIASGQATVAVKRGDRTITATVPIPKGMMR